MSVRGFLTILAGVFVTVLGDTYVPWEPPLTVAQPAGPTLTITPSQTVIATNGIGSLSAVYDPDGPAGPALEAYLDPTLVLWSSTQPHLASIDAHGTARGHAEGTVLISVEDHIHNLTATALVTIAGTVEEHSVTAPDGRMRSVLLYVPAGYDPTLPTPLVLAFHGGGGNAEGMMRIAQLNLIAQQHNFLVAYPNGTGLLARTWNAGACCGYAARHAVDDIGFTRALIQYMQQIHTIDTRRIFATGMSNGAMFAHRLACELSEEIAAIAPVAGGLNLGGDFPSCTPSRPVSLMAFHGTTDENYPYHGGIGPESHINISYSSIPRTVTDWVARNGIPLESKTVLSSTDEEGSEGIVSCETYFSLFTANEVTLCTVNPPVKVKAGEVIYDGGGHAWPGGVKGSSGGADIPTQDISASAMIWDFFKAHPK